MVILMVKGTPVLSLVISVITNEDGDFVGNGPSVSDDVEVQVPVVPPEPVSVPELDPDPVSFLQELASGATKAAIPKADIPLRKKSFLSIHVDLIDILMQRNIQSLVEPYSAGSRIDEFG